MIDSKTKKIAISAMLVALSIVYTVFMITIPFGFWSFTPFSHIFIMLGTIISPYVGIFTSIGSFIGFFLKTQDPFILARAGSHILFVFVLIFLLKKITIKKFSNTIMIAVITGIVHSVFEILAIFIVMKITGTVPKTADVTLYIVIGCGIGTFMHSIIDFYAAFGTYKLLKKAHVIELN